MQLYYIPNLFDEAELKIIDNVISDDQWDIAEVGFQKSMPGIRSTKIKRIDDDILNKKLAQSFFKANNYYKFIIIKVHDVGILKYNIGDYYKKHVDIGGPDDLKAGFPSRKLSLIVSLSNNNDYEGGDILFHTDENPINMKKKYNTGTFFPSYVLHEVTKIKKGTRYSLVAWAIGEPFK